MNLFVDISLLFSDIFLNVKQTSELAVVDRVGTERFYIDPDETKEG